jgi:hypothetical protein
MGFLDGLFVAESTAVDASIGRHIPFGEVLGKHSDIAGTLEASEIKVVSEDQNYIAKTLDIFGSDLMKNTESKRKYFTLCGYNPLDYLANVEDD